MRIYIINADDLIVTREAPAEPGENEVVVASLNELRAARLSGKRLLALWNGLPNVDRLSKVGNREALVDRLWSALEALPDPQPARASKQAEVIGLLRRPEGVTVDEVRAATGWQPPALPRSPPAATRSQRLTPATRPTSQGPAPALSPWKWRRRL